MASKSQPSRWLAPLALFLAAFVTLLILASGGGSSSGSADLAPTRVSTTETAAKTTGARFYEVRSGDTLTSISIETGVPVETLQQLNPGLDTQALQPGQRLRLRS